MVADETHDVGGLHFHRWAAALAFVVISYVTVLNLGKDWELGWDLTLACAGLGVFTALAGVAVSIVFPPDVPGSGGMMRSYTLFVSLEMFFFVLVFGVTRFMTPPAILKIGLALAWTAVNFRLLQLSSRESDEASPWHAFIGSLLGLLLYGGVLAACQHFLPGTENASETPRLLVSGFAISPMAAYLGFVIAATFGTTPPSLVTWARAGAAYLVVLPTLLAFALAVS